MLANFLQDWKVTFRSFNSRPASTVLTILILALGIGVNTAIFTAVDTVLLRPLPYKDAERLVTVWHQSQRLGVDQDPLSYPTFIDLRNQSRTISHWAAISPEWSFLYLHSGGAERIPGYYASPEIFPLLGVTPVQGRLFHKRDDLPSAQPVVLLSHHFWQSHFGSDPKAVGKIMNLGHPHTIVGVLPPGFRIFENVDVWVPLQLNPMLSRGRSLRFLSVIGRLAPQATPGLADTEIRQIAARLGTEYPDTNKELGARVVSLQEVVVGKVRDGLVLLLASAGFVLLIACANVGNLILTHALARRKQITICAALGATRGRILQMLMTESAILAVLGGAAGIAFSFWSLEVLPLLAPSGFPRLQEIRIDLRILSISFLASLLTGLLTGMIPALEASRFNLQDSLKEHYASESPRSRRIRRHLAVFEIAVALIVLIGAGLFTRSFQNVLNVDPGFKPDRLLTLQVSSDLEDDEQRAAFYRELLRRIEGVPGVAATGAASRIPLRGGVTTKLEVEGMMLPEGERPEVEFRRATANYFEAMGIPLLGGRTFGEHDDFHGSPVAVINESAARRLWPGEDPVGKRIRPYGAADRPWLTVIGIVGNVRHFGLEEASRPELYVSFDQGPPFNSFLAVRAGEDPGALIPAVRETIRRMDPMMAVYNVGTMEQLLSDSVARRRFGVFLVGAFGILALILAASGIYGVLSQQVLQRLPEFGIRMAVGATTADVTSIVLGYGVRLAVTGILLGLIAALSLKPLIAGFMFGVSSADPLTFAVMSLVLTMLCLLSCYLPARIAGRQNPLAMLRCQ